MKEVAAIDPSWSDDVKRVHTEHQQFISGSLPNTVSWYNERTRLVIDLLRKFAPDAKRVLDIGCAQGTIAITLSDLGYQVTGNDIRPYYLTYAKARDNSGKVNFVCANFLEFSPDEKFDAVLLTEVIEHVVDHREFIQHIRACLAPGGVLVITTPNYDFISQPLPSFSEINLEENRHKAFTADGNDHFYLFKKSELVELLEGAGFTTLVHRYFLPFLQYGNFKLRYLWKIFPTSVMERFSKRFDGSSKLCAQQCVVVRNRAA